MRLALVFERLAGKYHEEKNDLYLKLVNACESAASNASLHHIFFTSPHSDNSAQLSSFYFSTLLNVCSGLHHPSQTKSCFYLELLIACIKYKFLLPTEEGKLHLVNNVFHCLRSATFPRGKFTALCADFFLLEPIIALLPETIEKQIRAKSPCEAVMASCFIDMLHRLREIIKFSVKDNIAICLRLLGLLAFSSEEHIHQDLVDLLPLLMKAFVFYSEADRHVEVSKSVEIFSECIMETARQEVPIALDLWLFGIELDPKIISERSSFNKYLLFIQDTFHFCEPLQNRQFVFKTWRKFIYFITHRSDLLVSCQLQMSRLLWKPLLKVQRDPTNERQRLLTCWFLICTVTAAQWTADFYEACLCVLKQLMPVSEHSEPADVVVSPLRWNASHDPAFSLDMINAWMKSLFVPSLDLPCLTISNKEILSISKKLQCDTAKLEAFGVLHYASITQLIPLWLVKVFSNDNDSLLLCWTQAVLLKLLPVALELMAIPPTHRVLESKAEEEEQCKWLALLIEVKGMLKTPNPEEIIHSAVKGSRWIVQEVSAPFTVGHLHTMLAPLELLKSYKMQSFEKMKELIALLALMGSKAFRNRVDKEDLSRSTAVRWLELNRECIRYCASLCCVMDPEKEYNLFHLLDAWKCWLQCMHTLVRHSPTDVHCRSALCDWWVLVSKEILRPCWTTLDVQELLLGPADSSSVAAAAPPTTLLESSIFLWLRCIVLFCTDCKQERLGGDLPMAQRESVLSEVVWIYHTFLLQASTCPTLRMDSVCSATGSLLFQLRDKAEFGKSCLDVDAVIIFSTVFYCGSLFYSDNDIQGDQEKDVETSLHLPLRCFNKLAWTLAEMISRLSQRTPAADTLLAASSNRSWPMGSRFAEQFSDTQGGALSLKLAYDDDLAGLGTQAECIEFLCQAPVHVLVMACVRRLWSCFMKCSRLTHQGLLTVQALFQTKLCSWLFRCHRELRQQGLLASSTQGETDMPSNSSSQTHWLDISLEIEELLLNFLQDILAFGKSRQVPLVDYFSNLDSTFVALFCSRSSPVLLFTAHVWRQFVDPQADFNNAETLQSTLEQLKASKHLCHVMSQMQLDMPETIRTRLTSVATPPLSTCLWTNAADLLSPNVRKQMLQEHLPAYCRSPVFDALQASCASPPLPHDPTSSCSPVAVATESTAAIPGGVDAGVNIFSPGAASQTHRKSRTPQKFINKQLLRSQTLFMTPPSRRRAELDSNAGGGGSPSRIHPPPSNASTVTPFQSPISPLVDLHDSSANMAFEDHGSPLHPAATALKSPPGEFRKPVSILMSAARERTPNRKRVLFMDEDSASEDYVFIPPKRPALMQTRVLTDHQKDRFKEQRKEYIPAMYNALDQSSQDSMSVQNSENSNDCIKSSLLPPVVVLNGTAADCPIIIMDDNAMLIPDSEDASSSENRKDVESHVVPLPDSLCEMVEDSISTHENNPQEVELLSKSSVAAVNEECAPLSDSPAMSTQMELDENCIPDTQLDATFPQDSTHQSSPPSSATCSQSNAVVNLSSKVATMWLNFSSKSGKLCPVLATMTVPLKENFFDTLPLTEQQKVDFFRKLKSSGITTVGHLASLTRVELNCLEMNEPTDSESTPEEDRSCVLHDFAVLRLIEQLLSLQDENMCDMAMKNVEQLKSNMLSLRKPDRRAVRKALLQLLMETEVD